ncbi:MAG TPA: hypothetical protein VK201_03595, partial [bacterium]|nr:hypothetical protein [bacterium]
RQFPTVEALLNNLHKVSIPEVRPRIEPLRERILLNKQLATPLIVSFNRRPKLAIVPPHRKALRALADEAGVGSIAPR